MNGIWRIFVVSLREPFMDVINLLNEQPYTIHVGKIGDTFRVDDVVFGSLVPWDGVWYWSGVQQKYAQVTDEVIQQIKRDFPYTHRRSFIGIVRSWRRRCEPSSASIINNSSITMAQIWSPTRMARQWRKIYKSFISISLQRHPKKRWKPFSSDIICRHHHHR